jgi:hypothetical protein
MKAVVGTLISAGTILGIPQHPIAPLNLDDFAVMHRLPVAALAALSLPHERL